MSKEGSRLYAIALMLFWSHGNGAPVLLIREPGINRPASLTRTDSNTAATVEQGLALLETHGLEYASAYMSSHMGCLPLPVECCYRHQGEGIWESGPERRLGQRHVQRRVCD